MNTDPEKTFDAGEYWRERVVSGADLSVVGHRSMGSVYNAHIYERRIEVLEDMLSRHTGKAIKDLRILDIGCGSGFYTGYWAARGVREYVGVDISQATVRHLAQQFPNFEFVHCDITESNASALPAGEPFDIVTIFDVFYHIVDDEKFARAVKLVAQATGPATCVLVMDQLCADRYQLSRHVVYRNRFEYLSIFGEQGLALADDELLFHFLVPPLSGSRWIDIPAAAVFKVTGLVLRLSKSLASWTAAALRRLDTRQRELGRRVSNSEMIVFKRSGASVES